MTKYTSVSLGKELLEKVDFVIGDGAYSSRADFVKQAIRHELTRLKKGAV